MPSSATVWLSALLFSSIGAASPLVAESFGARSPSVSNNLISKASVPRAPIMSSSVPAGTNASSTAVSGECKPAMPGYVDPNAGSVGNAPFIGMCAVYKADFDMCSSSSPCDGTATWYNVSAGVTGCGGYYPDTQKVVALSIDYIMGNLSSGISANPYCNSTITVTYGSTTVPGIQVVDKCAGCQSRGHIDLSPGAFSALEMPLGAGHEEINWYFET